MSIQSEIQLLAPTAIVELFALDTSNLPGGAITYFHAGTNKLSGNVVWQGVPYQPLPVESEGFDVNSKGTLPRPKIRIANIGSVFSAQVRDNDDLVGCKVVRKRTFVRFLDAVNFVDGINATANPSHGFPDDTWFIDRKTSENRYLIEWELASAFDLQGVRLPFREVIQNSCTWLYRSSECGYTGTAYFDTNDAPCAIGSDFCSKRMSSCRVRFPNATLPYGGFPGVTRYGG
jgi:lambda family phage minor tail protein L